MRPTFVILALALAPGMAAAQSGVDPFLQKPPPPVQESGVTIGLSAGYAIPMGSTTGAAGDELSKIYSSAIPLQAELGYRFSPRLYVGGFFQYALGSVGSSISGTCGNSGVSCSATDIRFGADVRYTFVSSGTLLPWVGVGVGYEIAKVGITVAGQSLDLASLKGWEFGHVSVGVDFRVSPLIRVGPFATITFAQFSSFDSQYDPNTGQINPGSQSIDIQQKAFHEWMQLGVKVAFDL